MYENIKKKHLDAGVSLLLPHCLAALVSLRVSWGQFWSVGVSWGQLGSVWAQGEFARVRVKV